jgi:hypothetical protein
VALSRPQGFSTTPLIRTHPRFQGLNAGARGYRKNQNHSDGLLRSFGGPRNHFDEPLRSFDGRLRSSGGPRSHFDERLRSSGGRLRASGGHRNDVDGPLRGFRARVCDAGEGIPG